MQTAAPRYFLSADRQTQCLVPMSDNLHRMIWGVATYSNQPFKGAELVTAADPLCWLEGQMATRLGAAHAAQRIARAKQLDAGARAEAA